MWTTDSPTRKNTREFASYNLEIIKSNDTVWGGRYLFWSGHGRLELVIPISEERIGSIFQKLGLSVSFLEHTIEIRYALWIVPVIPCEMHGFDSYATARVTSSSEILHGWNWRTKEKSLKWPTVKQPEFLCSNCCLFVGFHHKACLAISTAKKLITACLRFNIGWSI